MTTDYRSSQFKKVISKVWMLFCPESVRKSHFVLFNYAAGWFLGVGKPGKIQTSDS
jgi:hypothetical protein